MISRIGITVVILLQTIDSNKEAVDQFGKVSIAKYTLRTPPLG